MDLLKNPAFAAFVDASTARVRPRDKLPVDTWCGLVDTYIVYVENEKAVAFSRAPTGSNRRGAAFFDSAAIGTGLRRLLQVADNEARSGQRLQLHRRARKLIRHFAGILSLPDCVGSQMWGQYLTCVVQHVLCHADYLGLADPEHLGVMCDAFVAGLESLRSSSPDAVPPGVDTLLVALAGITGDGFPGELPPDVVTRLGACLTLSLRWMAQCTEMGRRAELALGCLSSWLLCHGLDYPQLLADMHKEVYPFVALAWAQGRPKLRDAVVFYLLTQTQLGVIPQQAQLRVVLQQG
ncbi:hypothetical protein FOA52_004578 [Chlamydomonas sp. UWO 241]|nr:hypothetical protein FOA52_004578 [Chlamydomonas sp. UWO 241]